jgi:hypothetical protein
MGRGTGGPHGASSCMAWAQTCLLNTALLQHQHQQRRQREARPLYGRERCRLGRRHQRTCSRATATSKGSNQLLLGLCPLTLRSALR